MMVVTMILIVIVSVMVMTIVVMTIVMVMFFAIEMAIMVLMLMLMLMLMEMVTVGDQCCESHADGDDAAYDCMTTFVRVTIPSLLFFLTGSQGCTVRLWDVSTQREVPVLEGHTKELTQLRSTRAGSEESRSWDFWSKRNHHFLRQPSASEP